MSTIHSSEIFGAEIQYFRTEPRYWESILKHFRDTGLRCVTTYVPWSTHLVGLPDAKHPAGILDFEGRTDERLNLLKFLELVEKLGLNLNFRSGPFCCNEMVHGGYPSWLVLGDPNMMVWDYQNRTTQGYWIGKREGSQPSYLHPEYLKWCEKWFREVDKIAVPHLHKNGGCITMMNLDNEVSYIVQDSFLNSDYNPVNVKPGGYYHQFLEQKYGSISNLPYPGSFSSFERVEAPRSVPGVLGNDLPVYLDWVEFKTWAMSEYIRRLRQMHEANGVEGVTFMTNFNPHLPEGVPARMPDFEEASGGIVGYDFYRGAFMSYSGYHSMARVLKLMNATLSFTWSAEFMSGLWNKDRSKTGRISDDHMRFMARCALAHGCKAISWFMFHDRDCWGDSPVSSHAHLRPSIEVLRETPEILFRKIKSWDALEPQCDVGIIYDLLQHQHTSIGDPSPCDDNNLHIGAPVIDGSEAGRASQEYIGLFRLVEQSGMQAAAVDIIHSPENLSAYPVVFLPGSPVIEELALKALEHYVKCGGKLVVSGPLPVRNERGECIEFLEHGSFVWHKEYLAAAEAEEDSLESIRYVTTQLKNVTPHVRLSLESEVSWVNWQPEGGQRLFRQARNFGSAILHKSPEETILFVLNHYIDAVRFLAEFPNNEITELRDIDTGMIISVVAGKAELDLDRKSAAIFSVTHRS